MKIKPIISSGLRIYSFWFACLFMLESSSLLLYWFQCINWYGSLHTTWIILQEWLILKVALKNGSISIVIKNFIKSIRKSIRWILKMRKKKIKLLIWLLFILLKYKEINILTPFLKKVKENKKNKKKHNRKIHLLPSASSPPSLKIPGLHQA